MPCDTIGEFVIVDDGNAGLNGYMVEGSEGPEDRDDRIGLEDIISLSRHHDGRSAFGQLDQPQRFHGNGAGREGIPDGRLFV